MKLVGINVGRSHRQQGVALISMLLVFTLVVILIAGAVSRMGLDIRKSGYHQAQSQGYQYLLGGEALARQILYADWQQDNKAGLAVDHLTEAWSAENQFELDDGLIRIKIRDLQSRFNINNIINAEGKLDGTQKQQLGRLLQLLEISGEQLDLIVDWLDADNLPTSYDGEDSRYLSLEPGYRTANGPMAHISELAALNVFSRQQLQSLQEVLCALPEKTTINPNTASAVVLSSLYPGLNGEQVVQAREGSEGFVSNEVFLQSDALAGLEFPADSIDVSSRYFEVWVAVTYRQRNGYQRSVLVRDKTSGTIKTLYRSLQKPRQVFAVAAVTNVNE